MDDCLGLPCSMLVVIDSRTIHLAEFPAVARGADHCERGQ